MKVWLKNEIFSFHNDQIKKIAMQNQGNIIAFSSGKDGDSLKLVKINLAQNIEQTPDKLNFDQVVQQNTIKQSINVLSWSPNDQQLAIAYDKLIVYNYIAGNLKKLKEYSDHELEITCMSFSPDSTRICTGGMDRKIIINDIIKEQTIFKTQIEFKILGLVWDTFDKYLSVLQGDNQVAIWKTNNFQKQYSIDLNFPTESVEKKINHSKKEDRKIDWSSDYRYILVPSLDDKVVPLVCVLDRNQEFQISASYMGPFSSINCVKFNPNLYQYQDKVINIFALGDNDGNITIWGVGDGYVQKKPFSLFKSHKNGQELIEDITWNPRGNVMIATTMKRYLFVAVFSENFFGQKLSKEEQKMYLEGQYGGVRNTSQGRQFKIYQPNLNPEIAEQLRKKEEEERLRLEQEQEKQNQELKNQKFVFTKQQVTVQNGKKKIIPAKQVVQSSNTENDKKNENQQQIQQNANNTNNSNNQGQQQQQVQQQNIQIGNQQFVKKDPTKSLVNQEEQQQQKQQQQEQEKQQQQIQNKHLELNKPIPFQENVPYPLNQNKILEISKIRIDIQSNQQNAEIQEQRIQQKVICTQTNNNGKEHLWSTILEGQILFLQRCNTYLYFYTDENLLYVIDFNGRKFDLPFIVHNVSYMKVNNKGQILLITSKGYITVQDIFQKKNIMENDAKILIQENIDLLQKEYLQSQVVQVQQQQNNQLKCIKNAGLQGNFKDPIENVMFDNNSLIVITFKTGQTFFYSQDNNSWHKLDNSIFELNMFNNVQSKPENIIKVANQNQQQNNPTQNTHKFFELLMVGEEDIKQINNNNMQLASKLEERILFIMKYAKDQVQIFQEQFLRYIKVLCDLREINKLRQLLLDGFINTSERLNIFLTETNINKKSLFKEIQIIGYNFPYVQQLFQELNTMINL